MKILIVHPGASWSVADLYIGLVPAFRKAGVEVFEYALDGRLNVEARYLTDLWRRGGKKVERPNQADFMYRASIGVIERVLFNRIDWVLVMSGGWFSPDVLVMLRELSAAGLTRVAWLFTECPYEDHWQLTRAPFIDLIWVNERADIAPFQAQNGNAHYYRHAIDPEKHRPTAADPNVAAHDVVFVGTGWPERIRLLREIDWDGLDFGLYGSWELLGSRNRLRRYMRDGVIDNADAAALYRAAKVGLNLHRHAGGAESMNPRCFELAATGRFFISDRRAELTETFGELVPTFETAEECEALLRRYVADEAARREIAAQLPERVAADTFDNRAIEMLKLMEA